MNIERLRAIQKTILAEPTQFNMHDWWDNDDDSTCGTTACIAGWTCLLEFRKEDSKVGMKSVLGFIAVRGTAIEILGITKEQADKLFYINYWPAPYAGNYMFLTKDWPTGRDHISCELRASLRQRMAQCAADRIEHFIEHGC